MTRSYAFDHTHGYWAQLFRCPLLVPIVTGETCAHEQFAIGPGCVKYLNIEAGGRMRAELDRHSAAYQATALGIERPRVRQQHSVRTLNTLTYLVINARALQWARSLNAQDSSAPTLCRSRPSLDSLEC